MTLHKTTEIDYRRDDSSGALINTNVSAYKAYKMQRDGQRSIDGLNQDLNELKDEFQQIKALLLKVLEEKNV